MKGHQLGRWNIALGIDDGNQDIKIIQVFGDAVIADIDAAFCLKGDEFGGVSGDPVTQGQDLSFVIACEISTIINKVNAIVIIEIQVAFAHHAANFFILDGTRDAGDLFFLINLRQ